ncbi:MAG: metallophosphoesterase [Alkaliphilus sp.]
MALYAISDLHLSGTGEKPMDVFGENWIHHTKKIEDSWMRKVKGDDTVLIAGDISWAMNLADATIDLEWINELPGRKILCKGNHDYWWSSITKINSLHKNMDFLQNNFFSYNEYAICGTRGWICPNIYTFTEDDNKIYIREANRLETSLERAKNDGFTKIIAMLHYPPTNESMHSSLFTELFEKYNVEEVVYGHLHGSESYKIGLKGLINGVRYRLVSCDYLDFELVKIL